MTEKMFVLVVESDAICLLAMSSALDALGVRCKRNTSGARVIEQVRAMNPRPQIILIDLDLPQGDPLAIAEALRMDSTTAFIPVIVVSSDADYARLSRHHQKLFAGHLSRPVARGALNALVRPLITRHNAGVTVVRV
ncbi:MAG: response regulator [Chloroflexota bacterium]|nr:response regulator [Chloroflexota bacterium]